MFASIISILKSSLLFVAVFSLFLFSGCSGAEPNSGDLVRVKKDYLDLRFQRPFVPKLEDLDDEQLLQLSCQKNKVRCDRLLELMEKEDAGFYKKFKETTIK